MKKVISLTLLVAVMFSVKAQTSIFKPFKWDFAVGYAIPSGKGVKGGLIFSNEPKYAIKDNIAVGLKLEGALTAAVLNQGLASEEVKVQLRSMYQATGDYYFNNNKFRPFAGLCVGLMRINSATASTSTTTTIDQSAIEAGTRFAVTPRVGFEAGHFRLSAEYNYGTKNSSYFGIKIGAFAGGGRK